MMRRPASADLTRIIWGKHAAGVKPGPYIHRSSCAGKAQRRIESVTKWAIRAETCHLCRASAGPQFLDAPGQQAGESWSGLDRSILQPVAQSLYAMLFGAMI